MSEKYAIGSSAFFQAALDSLGSTLCVIDEDSTIVYVNQSWKDFAAQNGSTDSMLGRQYFHTCSTASHEGCEDGNTVSRGLNAVMSGELGEFHFEYPCHSPDEQRWFTMSARPLQWAGQKLFVIKHKNITDRKIAEIEGEFANRELARSNRELDQFAYIASHDLQEPIRSVSSMAEFLANDPETHLSPAGLEAKTYMLAACTRMNELVRGLLEFGRIGHNTKATLTDLNKVFDDILQDLQIRIKETHAAITVPPDMPSMPLYAVEIRLLFQNLISNAIKFSPPDRRPEVQVSWEQIQAHRWRFFISDNGIGIPADEQEKVFVIFQRSTPSSQFEGTGIGLAHCRKIAEIHGGKIWVEASSEAGTTMGVEIEAVGSRIKK